MDSNPDLTAARHIFISFASADAEVAHRIVAGLEAAGVRCWISDRDIDPAESYPAAITAAIAGCGALLLLLTEQSNRSPHVVREVELAFNTRRPILPVRIARVMPTSDLEYFLSRTQWLDAGTGIDDHEIEKISTRAKQLLESPDAIAQPWPVDPWWRRPRTIASVVAIAVALVLFAFYWRSSPVPGSLDAPKPDTPPVPAGPETKVNPRDGQEYAWIPPGTFNMGCSEGDPECGDDEKPVRVVNVTTGFWLGRTEVVADQDERLPVVAVTRAEAKAHCAGVGGRLPNEAEWEYAARGGTSTRHYNTLSEIAWYGDNSDERPHPVAMKAPNAFGLYDMLGNVSEWVLDRYYNAYDDSSDPMDVEEPLAGNALGTARGGSWISESAGVRASRRLAAEPDAAEPHIGFRCAIDEL